MTPRLALRFVLLSLIAAAVLLGLAFLSLRQFSPATQTEISSDIPSIEAQLASQAMPLDTNGIGSQVISGTQIAVRLWPYPAQAGQISQLSIVGTAQDGRPLLITPTLFISADGLSTSPSEVLQIDMQQQQGRYTTQNILFPVAGRWRVRIYFYLNETDTSSAVLLIRADK